MRNLAIDNEASDSTLPSTRCHKVFIIHKVKKKQNWTAFEDKILLMVVKSYGRKNWKAIASQLPKRTASQCYMRYNIIRTHYTKGMWTLEEDTYLMKLVKTHGKKWSIIAKVHIVKRTGKQIRDRYVNYLDPELNREPFSEEEDNHLIKLYLKLGRRWSLIAKEMKTRTSEMVKNRFHAVLVKKVH
jgi:myb proto-oncogene protein